MSQDITAKIAANAVLRAQINGKQIELNDQISTLLKLRETMLVVSDRLRDQSAQLVRDHTAIQISATLPPAVVVEHLVPLSTNDPMRAIALGG